MFSSIIKKLQKYSNSASVSMYQKTSLIKCNVTANAPERFYVQNNFSDSKVELKIGAKEKVENSRFYSGSRENPDYYTLENIKEEINAIEFSKEKYPDSEKVASIKKMLFSNLEDFDKSLSKDQPNFDQIQSSFRFLYSSYHSNPALADVFGRFYHYQTKIYERHYINNEIKFQFVPNLNSASLGFSLKLISEDRSSLVLHKVDYQVNIDTMKFAHEIATLRAAFSLLEKKKFHTADRIDVEQMLLSQDKNVRNFTNQKVADVLVQQDDDTFFYKDIKHVHSNKVFTKLNKSQVIRTSHYDHYSYCDFHVRKIDCELAGPSVTLKRQIVLKATKRVFLNSKINNDVKMLNQINETEYPFSLVITNDNYEN